MKTIKGSPKRLVATVLALGVATGTVVFGSQAAWFAQTTNPGNSVTAGTLTMSNSRDGLTVLQTAVTGAKPGDANSDTVLLTNTGSSAATVTLTQDNVTAPNMGTSGDSFGLKIHDDTRNWCYWPNTGAGACATYGAWDASATVSALAVVGTGGATWAPAEAHTFTVSWQFTDSVDAGNATDNTSQSANGLFDLTWDAV